MLIHKGEMVHVVIRRIFDGDLRRHFVGTVQEVEGLAARLHGYAFVFDENRNQFVKRPELRDRLVGLAAPEVVINILPAGLALEKLTYTINNQGMRVLTDGGAFQLDVSEFGSRQ